MDTIISMYTKILSCSRATNICWMKNNPDGNRAFSSSLLRAIIAHNHLPFFKIFSNLEHFCPNFQIFCPFLTSFCPFSGKSHAWPYSLEYTLGNLLKVLVCLFLYFESKQVIILWKVSKKNMEDLKPNIFLSLLTLLEFYLHLKTFFAIFSNYRFQMKQISTTRERYYV